MGGPAMNMHEKTWHLHGEQQKAPYNYKGCGLDDVFLVSGYDLETTPYGGGIRIRHMDKLHDAIGLFLVTNRKVLSGKELRFLRTQMGFTQSDLARFMGCNAQQVARYEKDQNEVPGPADRLIRLLYKDHVKEAGSRLAIKKVLDTLDRLDDSVSAPMVFGQVDSKWKKAISC
jgi:putative transcriptional regulator